MKPAYLGPLQLRRKRRHTIDAGERAVGVLCARWLVRLLLNAKFPTGKIAEILDDEVAAELLGDPLGMSAADRAAFFSTFDLHKAARSAQLQSWFQGKLEELGADRIPADVPLFSNVSQLCDELGMGEVEHELICFVALMTGTNKFHSLLCRLDSNLRLEPAIGLIATAMGRSRTLIRDALNPRAPLAQSGLIRVDPDFSDLLCGFNCIEGLENILMRPYASRAELTAAFLHQPPAGNLSLEDFEHLRIDANILLAYLGGALERGEPGTNIVLYGPPGVGKTEFTLALARKLDATLYEVRTEDADGDSPTRDARLSSYMLGQRFLCKTPRAMLLFDEIEDVFGDPGYAPRSGRDTHPLSKAWVNRLLESNPVPAVWITNSLYQMDPAFRRRFDYCLEFPRPPLQTRRRFVQDLLTPLGIGRKVTDVMATDEYLSPAIVQKARKLVVRAGKVLAEQRNEMALLVYRNASRVLGHVPRLQSANDDLYDLSFLNVNTDVNALAAGLKRLRRGTLCFYGPPGTGKSAMAQHLAGDLGMPALLRRASDILSPFLGETEQLIARMFEEATRTQSLLIVDEADSFLYDRRSAHRQWEITQVNEMLLQIEAFQGICVFTTNLMDNLDPATLRRFSLKVKFDYLTVEQREAIFRRYIAEVPGGADLSAAQCSRLRALGTLTPGDFAAARRQLELGGQSGAAPLLEALEQESRLQRGNHRPIGFAA